MDLEKILEIAEFRGVNEVLCKSCGVLWPVNETVITQEGAKIRSECPECRAWLRWLPTAKTWRIFYNAKYGLVEIEKVPTGRLVWHLKNVKINDDLRNAIEQLIERRTSDPETFREPVGDIETAAISEAIERREFLKKEISKLEKIKVAQVRDHNPNADYLATEKLQRFLKVKALEINDLQKELRRVEKKVKRFEDDEKAKQYAASKNRSW